MYNNLRAVLGKTVDVDAVLTEAITMAGDNPSMELIMALSIKHIADKFAMQVQELRDSLIINKTTPEELDAKLAPVLDLSGARNLKAADANLAEVVELTSNMTQEQLREFDLKYRKEAAAGDPTITVGPDDLDSKDIYLRTKIGVSNIYSIIGLHAVGHAGPYEYTMHHQDGRIEHITTNFMALETWGNEYDDDHNMLGRGSFRLHTHDIESYAKELEAEGWERYEGPKRKNT